MKFLKFFSRDSDDSVAKKLRDDFQNNGCYIKYEKKENTTNCSIEINSNVYQFMFAIYTLVKNMISEGNMDDDDVEFLLEYIKENAKK